MADLIKDLDVIRQDGMTVISLSDGDFETIAETRKGKDGEQVATGVTKRVFHYRIGVKAVENGEGATMVMPDGSTGVVRELKITERITDAAALQEKRDANRWKNFAQDFRRFAGLGSSKKAVAESDRLTQKDVENFMNGFRKVKGHFFEDLPTATRELVEKAYSDLLKKNSGKTSMPTMSQLAEMAALAAANGTPLGEDWHTAFEAAKAKAARLSKGKAAKAAQPSAEEMTEQAFEG